MRSIGIDPGQDGAIAVIDDSGPLVFRFKNATKADVANSFRSLNRVVAFAYLEKVSASPRMGVVSAFKFGASAGYLEACLHAFQIPFEFVTTAKWQKTMGCMTKGDKNVSKAKAQQLFPNVKVVHGNADALLIAEYGRRCQGS